MLENVNISIEKRAALILADNHRLTHTVPAPNNYPHQWLWDSSFVAVGLSHLDPDKADIEITSLLEGQWANGMLPHMLFNRDKLGSNPKLNLDYILWNSHRSPDAPTDVFTSGITQPPIVAEAVQQVGRRLSGEDRKDFMVYAMRKLIRYHQWIYAERDYNQNGLMSAVHPWETGMDNTPPWVGYMRQHEHSGLVLVTDNIVVNGLLKAIRRDAKETMLDERTLTSDGIIFTNAALRLRHLRYDKQRMMEQHSPYIEDVAMNSILIRNNAILREMSEDLDYSLPEELTAKMRQTEQSLDSLLWDEEAQLFYSRDAKTKQLLKTPTVGSLLPLYAGTLDPIKTAQLVDHLRDNESFATDFAVPSVPINDENFDEKRMWSGPTWINMNWLIIKGLRRSGYRTDAEELTEKTLRMVYENGYREYFSAINGEGLGIDNFSWTAALVIDLLRNPE